MIFRRNAGRSERADQTARCKTSSPWPPLPAGFGEKSLHVGRDPFGGVEPRAFSSEVETGSRQENASNQESRAPFRFSRNGKGSSRTQFSAAECFIAQMRIGDPRVRILGDGHEPNQAEEQRPCGVPIKPVHVCFPRRTTRRELQAYQYLGSVGEEARLAPAFCAAILASDCGLRWRTPGD
jgi:hypothetical protein